MALTKEQKLKAALDKKIMTWKVKPLEWVKDVFGDNIKRLQAQRGVNVATETGLTRQQEEALVLWGKLIRAKLRKAGGAELDEETAELSTKMGMSIQSSNGNGKDFLAALINWHFMDCFNRPKVMVTANTGKQLRSVYWSELSKIRGMSLKGSNEPDALTHLQENYTVQNDRMYRRLPNKDEEGKVWFTEAITINAKATPEEQGEALAGRHEDNMLIIVDEASGIPDAVFRPLERTLTGRLNLVFMIFNPTRNSGYAIESHTKHRDQWVALQWDALDCENVSQDQIARLRKYGEDSPAYRIGVLGLPPLSDSNALIPYEWITDAVNRELAVNQFDPVILGCDVGGGGDKSVVVVRQSGTVQNIFTNNSKDTMDVANWIASTFWREDASVAYVDIIGLGRGVYDRLNQMGVVARPADSRGKAKNDRYFNARAEMYFKLREQFEQKCISIPDDQELIDELGAIKTDPANQNKIIDKREIRKTLGFSPDRADSLAMSFYGTDDAYRKGKYKPARIDYKTYKSGVI